MVTKVKVICFGCDAEIMKDIKQVNHNKKRGTKNFCTRLCFYNSHITARHIPCTNCGKIRLVRPAELKGSKTGNTFCSKSCSVSYGNKHSPNRRGELHPNFKSTYVNYRKLAFLHYDHKCNTCDYNIEAILQVHHKDGDRKNNDITNLEILCPTHHYEKHYDHKKKVMNTSILLKESIAE